MTIFEIEYDQVKNKQGQLTGEVVRNRYKRDTTPEDLVVDAFLVKYKGRFKVWHKDGNESNNWYKNLLTVTPDDYKKLKAGKVTWQELNLEQGISDVKVWYAFFSFFMSFIRIQNFDYRCDMLKIRYVVFDFFIKMIDPYCDNLYVVRGH